MESLKANFDATVKSIIRDYCIRSIIDNHKLDSKFGVVYYCIPDSIQYTSTRIVLDSEILSRQKRTLKICEKFTALQIVKLN